MNNAAVVHPLNPNISPWEYSKDGERRTISPAHVAELTRSAITFEVATKHNIYTANTPVELPDEIRQSYGSLCDQWTPALVYPMETTTGRKTVQIKPQNPQGAKYLSPKKNVVAPLKVGLVSDAAGDDAPVAIIEGTKQPLAAVSAKIDAHYNVLRILGISGWSEGGVASDELSVVNNSRVVIVPDADVLTNVNVCTATSKLVDACIDAGAKDVSVAVVPNLGGANTGLDDYLASHPENDRSRIVKEILDTAALKKTRLRNVAKELEKRAKHAAAQSAHQQAYDICTTAVGDRTIIGTGAILNTVLDALTAVARRLSADNKLFRNSLGQICVVKPSYSGDKPTVQALSNAAQLASAFAPYIYPADLRAEYPTVETLRNIWAPADSKGEARVKEALDYGYGCNYQPLSREIPSQTWDAFIEYPPLQNALKTIKGVSSTPIVTPKGEIVTKDGYNEETGMYVVLDPAIRDLAVPKKPTQEQVDRARQHLLTVFAMEGTKGKNAWMFSSVIDQTNAIAALLTMFVRPNMPNSPLFLIDGLQPGTGKSRLMQSLHLITQGFEPASSVMPSDDTEMEKRLAAFLLAGETSIVFDETKDEQGSLTGFNFKSLRTALTSSRVNYRRLGSNELLKLENGAVMFALGNGINASADVNRRSCPIQLRSTLVDDPKERSNFLIPNITRYITNNRRALLQDCLTIIRAWFVAGQPKPDMKNPLESFDEWFGTIGGILQFTGFTHFLDNIKDFRANSDFDYTEMTQFLELVFMQFVDGKADPSKASFTSSQLSDALQSSRITFRPANLSDVSPAMIGRYLSQHDGRVYDELKLTSTNGRARSRTWVLTRKNTPGDGNGNGGSTPTSPQPTPPVTPAPDPNVSDPWELCEADTTAPTVSTDNEVVAQPDPSDEHQANIVPFNDKTAPRVDAVVNNQPVRIERRIDGMTGFPFSSIAHNKRVVYFDVETADADQLYTYGHGFIRLCGYAVNDGEVTITTDVQELADVLASADLIVGHNIVNFDLPAIELETDLDVDRLIDERKVVDTLLTSRQIDPPLSAQKNYSYSLDAVAQRYGKTGKLSRNGQTVLKNLAATYGGFDAIPKDNDDYRAYLVQDVELTREVAHTQAVDSYIWREHKIMRLLSFIPRNGFRVDEHFIAQLQHTEAQRTEDARHLLVSTYGLPADKKKPQASKAGREILEDVFSRLGIDVPRTAKSGNLSMRASDLQQCRDNVQPGSEADELLKALIRLSGESSVADTVAKHVRSGRVHPDLAASQATGRFSLTNPALTTLGKRERKNAPQRAMFLPDPGDVLVAIDLSQIDARAMGAHSQDAAYLDALEPGQDMHSAIAAAMFGTDRWDGTGHHPRRSDAKAVTHGTNYGMGARTLAQQSGMSQAEAAAMLDKLQQTYPEIAQFKRDVIYTGTQQQIIRNAFGRRMRIRPDKAYTQAPAAIGQGTARDIMAECLLRLPRELRSCLRAIVHDEIVLSVPSDRVEDVKKQLHTAFTFDFRIKPKDRPVPILADFAAEGGDWADVYRDEHPDWPEMSRDYRQNRPDSIPDWLA